MKNTLIKSNNMPSWMASAYPHVLDKVKELEVFPDPVNHVWLFSLLRIIYSGSQVDYIAQVLVNE